MPSVDRHRTALRRTSLSRPVRLALDEGLIRAGTTVLDFGCGLGDDLRHLEGIGVKASGWDPAHRPNGQRLPAEVVNLGFVVNVIEDPEERAIVLRQAWSLAREVLVVAAQLVGDGDSTSQQPYNDGCLTRLNTFQKYYHQQELKEWIGGVLGTAPVAAAPGVFYVFRDGESEQQFTAARFRRVIRAATPTRTEAVYRENESAFRELAHFCVDRGRLPLPSELPGSDLLASVCGSIPRAFRVLERLGVLIGWEEIRTQRAQDLLVYMALAHFAKLPAKSQLPAGLQADVRAFFGTYNKARATARTLLFSAGETETVEQACRRSIVGKQTATSLYVHVTAVPLLTPVLRVYEGCARALVGIVEHANAVKLHRDCARISYLHYQNFDTDPHPALSSSLVVNLRTSETRFYDYSDRANPPVLHKKEELVAPDYPERAKFERLTLQELKYGLYSEPERIGTREGWSAVLSEHGVRLRGHQLVAV